MAQVADIASAIIFVALVAVLVKNRNTATIIQALAQAFTGALKTAEG